MLRGLSLALLLPFSIALTASSPVQAQLLKQLEEKTGGGNAGNQATSKESKAATPPVKTPPPCPEIMAGMDAAKNWPDSCGLDRPPATLMPSESFAGNWEIEAPGNKFMESAVIALSHGHHGVGYHDTTSKLVSTGVMRGVGSAGYRSFNPSVRENEKGRLRVHLLSSGYSGQVPFWIEVKPTGDPNLMVGKWQFGDTKIRGRGVAYMRRLSAVPIGQVTIGKAHRGPQGYENDVFTVGDRPGRILRKHAVTCGAGRSRANCDGVWITIPGNFFGAHSVWIDPASHMEIRDSGWLCRNGQHRRFGAEWRSCGSKDKHADGVVALKLKLLFWDGIAPGRRTLWVNGTPIPIDMIIEGYPKQTLPQKPKLVALKALDETGAVLEALTEGSAFRLEAIYADEHPDPWVPVTMPETGRQTGMETVVLRRMSDGKSFRSAPLAIVDNGRER